jgi:hypothetical protein
MNNHGGARPGAGRKPKMSQYATQIAALNDRIADGLPMRAAALELLAEGGFEEIHEVWEPAGLIEITKQVVSGEGTVSMRELAFPHLDPEQLVCVKRTRQIAAPDRKANEYLINRIAGTPTQHIEADLDGDGPLFKVYVGIDPDQV